MHFYITNPIFVIPGLDPTGGLPSPRPLMRGVQKIPQINMFTTRHLP